MTATQPPTHGPADPASPDGQPCLGCRHSRELHKQRVVRPEAVEPAEDPPRYIANATVSVAGCRACHCPGFTWQGPDVIDKIRQIGARFPGFPQLTEARDMWTLGSVVDRFVQAMYSEGIPREQAISVANRVLYGHPDGTNARLDLGDRPRDIPHDVAVTFALPKDVTEPDGS